MCPLIILVQPVETTGTLAQSRKCYMNIQLHVCIGTFHHLKGKIKIILKPRPIGNEIKNMADGLSNIVLNMELYEGKDLMKNKDHVQESRATTVTIICLTRPYRGSGS